MYKRRKIKDIHLYLLLYAQGNGKLYMKEVTFLPGCVCSAVAELGHLGDMNE